MPMRIIFICVFIYILHIPNVFILMYILLISDVYINREINASYMALIKALYTYTGLDTSVQRSWRTQKN